MIDHTVLSFDRRAETCSEEAFIRFALFRQTSRYFESGSVYKTALCDNVTERMPLLLNGCRLYQCLIPDSCEELPDGAFLLKGRDDDACVLGYHMSNPVDDSDSLFRHLCESLTDFPVITPDAEKIPEPTSAEKFLLDAERYDTAACILCSAVPHTKELRDAWESLFANGQLPDSVSAIRENALRILGDERDLIQLDQKNIALDALKLCEDGSNDVILRLHETDGKEETHVCLMSELYDAGFRFDIRANESKTFRIDKDGYVRETNFLEGIIPPNDPID